MGSFLSLIFPVCECGIVPLVRRLFKKDMPIPMGVAFLLASPVINPIVIFSTYNAFGLSRIFFLRLVCSFMIAFVLALVFSSADKETLLRESTQEHIGIHDYSSESHAHEGHENRHLNDHAHDSNCESDCHCHCCLSSDDAVPQTIWQKLKAVLELTLDELFEIGRFLIVGAILSALMQTFIPQSRLLSIGQGCIISVIAMMVLAFVLSICSTVDTFVALGFTNSFSVGSVLSFLVFGPVVDIKSILLYARVFKP